jgi:hypothetical protein
MAITSVGERLEGSEIKGIVEDREEPYAELIRIFAVKPD